VIEGVMMRSPRFFAVACRRENREIVVQQESVESLLGKFQWLNKPFLRGTLALIDALVLGMKSLTFSANIAMEDAQDANPRQAKQPVTGEESGDPKASEQLAKIKHQPINDIAVGATVVLAIALAVGIFFVCPQLLVGLLKKRVHESILLNLMAGGVKFTLFIGYILAISLMRDIRRVFQYHGAEHRVINTFEAGLELAPENFAKHTTVHPRCGTSFILVVMVTSILVFCLLGWADVLWLRVVQRLLLLPVVAGLAYEVIRYAGRHRDSKVLNVLLAPGLWLQRLTTREPTDDQVEVAARALQAVLEKEAESQQPVVSGAGCSP